MIKYRLGFTIPAEVLFGLLSKVLPIEDLHVEEIVAATPPPPPAKVKRVAPPSALPPQFEREKRVPRKGVRLDIKSGANAIVMELFSDDKPHRAIELKSLFAARGLSHNGVGSALEKLKKRGLVFQPALGLWQRVASHEKLSA
jgi:hypothetical protein